MLIQRFLMAAVVAACSAIPAFATLQTYTSLTSFDTATGGDTFTNIAFAQGNLGTSTTVDGVVFSTSGASLTGEASPSGWPTGPTEPALASSEGGNTLTITLPAGAGAVDFYFGPLDYTGLQLTIADNAGGNFTTDALTQPNMTTPVFFGVTTTGNFTSFTIQSFSNPDMTTLDNLQFGQSDMSQTPEVATFLLVGTGLLLMGYFRRRRLARTPEARVQGALAGATA